jgi:hypothetical protein
MNANIGDIIVLDNGLKIKLIREDEEHFKTVDIDNNSDCTTNIKIESLKDFYRDNITWGHGIKEYKIVEIIRNTYSKPLLGIMPKEFYELQRAQDICRVLYEYINYEDIKYDLMIEWANELINKLYALKSENE